MISKRLLTMGACAAALAFAAPALAAAPAAPQDDAAKVARLSLDVQRMEDLRAVKKLQMTYAQYAQYGLWSQMSALFSAKGQLIWGKETVSGPAAIDKYLSGRWSKREGLAPGGVRAELIDTPVVHLSADGQSAKGRYSEVTMNGQFGGPDSLPGWGIGVMENRYVKENGVWKIGTLHYYPYAAGTYKDGWTTAGEVPFVPFHFTAFNASIPVPAVPAKMEIPALKGAPAAALADLNRRITALNDEDNIRNLNNAFGYYADRKMWDDAGDLFTADAVLEDADVGVYVGAKSIRHSFERLGPPGLKKGQLNERPKFDMTVSISADGKTAQMRGVEWRELGDNDTQMARLGLATFVNSFVKGADGKWRIREMRVFPTQMTDYYEGWNKSRIETPAPAAGFAPDKPAPAGDKMGDGVIPVFFQTHPVTGKPVVLPAGSKVAAASPLLPASGGAASAAPAAKDMTAGIADAKRRLSRSYGYDASDNMTHAFGFFLVDNDFLNEGRLYTKDGWRGKQALGFCIGAEHIAKCETSWGDEPLPHPRFSWGGRMMFQPVIVVSEDGKSSVEHTRLHSFSVDPDMPGVLSGAMYNDQFKVVNGVWKADVVSIEEPYWSSKTYKEGWSKWGDTVADTHKIPPPGASDPDYDRITKMKIRFYGIDDHSRDPENAVIWPNIKPMWFNYKNPVTGKEPPNYCPDIKTCEADLEAKHHVPVR